LQIFEGRTISSPETPGTHRIRSFPLIQHLSMYSNFNSPDLQMWLELVDMPWRVVSTHV
jgi:hypothetical protein